VRQDFEELGRRCVSRLLSGSEDEEPYPIEPVLVVRASTGPPSPWPLPVIRR
jgi:DNA-binding LacI/PurR family transcriptional regulator